MKNIILLFLLTILLAVNANAFGVSTFYYEGRPLILNPGEVKDIQVQLQNEATSGPISLKATIDSEKNIAQLTGKTIYNLGPGDKGVSVPITISIPENAQIGDKYQVSVSFVTATGSEGGMVELGTQITKGFDVVVGKVVEEEKVVKDTISPQTLMGILVLLSLAVLVLFILRKRKRK